MTRKEEFKVSASRLIRDCCQGCDYRNRIHSMRQGWTYSCEIKSVHDVLSDFGKNGKCTDAMKKGQPGVVRIGSGFSKDI